MKNNILSFVIRKHGERRTTKNCKNPKEEIKKKDANKIRKIHEKQLILFWFIQTTWTQKKNDTIHMDVRVYMN